MFYKLIEGKLVPFEGRFVKIDGRIISPPTSVALESLGYKRLADGEKPEYNPDTQCLNISSYEEKENVIQVVYSVANL